MADMSKYGKKEFPSQTENRKQWILDTVRANQDDVVLLLERCIDEDWAGATFELNLMKPMDRDALLQPNGILTNKQIELLK